MRSEKFCPKCGKTTEDLYNSLCSDCFLVKVKTPEEIPDKIKINTCKMCGKVYLGKGKFDNEEQAIQSFLEEVLDEKNVERANYRIAGETLFLTIKMKVQNLGKEMEKQVSLIFKTITCDMCNLRKSKYYNVTLQVRVPKNMQQKILDEIFIQIDNLNKTDNYSFVSAQENKKEGVDLLIGSKSAASHVVKYLKRKYHVKTKISRTLFGPVQGKKIYRDTILISLDK